MQDTVKGGDRRGSRETGGFSAPGVDLRWSPGGGSGQWAISPCLLPVGAGPGATLPAAGLGGKRGPVSGSTPAKQPARSQPASIAESAAPPATLIA